MNIFTVLNVSRVTAGAGSVSRIGEIATLIGARRLLIISDAGVAGTGLIDRQKMQLGKQGLEVRVLAETPPEPELGQVEAIVQKARQSPCDLVIGMGGGSAMDTAKLVAVLLANPLDMRQLLEQSLIPQRGIASLMIPTTAGTGSEATPNSIVLVPENELKVGIVNPKLIPDHVILDPELTISLPPAITAATGMDALAHAMECFTSKKGNPFSELYALKAISLISRSIRQAYRHGDDLDARQDMLLAAFYGGVCIATSSTTAVHALSYPLGGKYRIAHGISNAILLPYVMEFNSFGNEPKFLQMAEAMGICQSGMCTDETVQELIKALFDLNLDLDIPGDLKQWQITAKDLDTLVDGAAGVTRLLGNNPRPMNRMQIRSIYEQLL